MGEDLTCMVYVDASGAALGDLLRQVLSEDPEGAIFHGQDNELDVMPNHDFDRARCHEFPDGYLYFPTRLEIFPDEDRAITLEGQVALVSMLLRHLWAQGTPAVASASYEELLPQKGGYKSTDLPWPTPDTSAS